MATPGAPVDGGWLVYCPVVDATKGVQSAKVVGFQAIIITEVKATTSHKGISFHLYTGDSPPARDEPRESRSGLPLAQAGTADPGNA